MELCVSEIQETALSVDLSDGRTISVPLGWFPRLSHATRKERSEWQLIGRGQGIHWPLVDEDISVEGLLAGRPSGESQSSFAKWLAGRSRSHRKANGAIAHAARQVPRKPPARSKKAAK